MNRKTRRKIKLIIKSTYILTKDKVPMIMGKENRSNLTMMDKIQIKNPNNNKNNNK